MTMSAIAMPPPPTASVVHDVALAAIAMAAEAARALARAPPAASAPIVSIIARSGLAGACLAEADGGLGLASDPLLVLLLLEALRAVGRADLSAGRLLEGHVNAIRLLSALGSVAQRQRAARLVDDGGMLGIWAADLKVDPARVDVDSNGLRGAKAFCSGAGALAAALVTVSTEAGSQLLWLDAPEASRIDLGTWQPTGMAATESAVVRLDGLTFDPGDLVGAPGAYTIEPDFSGGIWRILAVQLGGIEALAEALRQHLRQTGRGYAPLQRARLADAVIAAETARLWVQQSALIMEDPDADVELAVAHVGLARHAVLRAAGQAIEAAQQGIGLGAMLAPHPVERLARDLATLLRQPDPDGARDRAAQCLIAQQRPVGEAWM